MADDRSSRNTARSSEKSREQSASRKEARSGKKSYSKPLIRKFGNLRNITATY